MMIRANSTYTKDINNFIKLVLPDSDAVLEDKSYLEQSFKEENLYKSESKAY